MRGTRAKVMISFFQMFWILVGGSLQVAEEGPKEKVCEEACVCTVFLDMQHITRTHWIRLKTVWQPGQTQSLLKKSKFR